MNNSMQSFFPNGINFPNMDINNQIRNLENRVYNLEKEVTKLKNKINKLENTPMPYQDNYTSNYNPNTYNMM